MAYRHIDLEKFSDEKPTLLNPNNEDHKEIISWFPSAPEGKKFKITKEGIYSMTRVTEAQELIKELQRILKTDLNKLTIIDATANMGGNVFAFAEYFQKVYAVEINKVNLAALRYNIKSLGLSNVKTINDDSVKLLTSSRSLVFPDVIFFDPPWGGVKYDKTKPMEMYLSDIPMSVLFNRIYKRYTAKDKKYQLIIMKGPKNYDVINLKKTTKNHKIWYKKNKKYMIVYLSPIY